MSSQPTESCVRILRQAVQDQATLQRECDDLADRIAKDSKRRGELAERLMAARQKIIAQLRAMDCEANGNNGWEGRIISMLSELERQANVPKPIAFEKQPV